MSVLSSDNNDDDDDDDEAVDHVTVRDKTEAAWAVQRLERDQVRQLTLIGACERRVRSASPIESALQASVWARARAQRWSARLAGARGCWR